MGPNILKLLFSVTKSEKRMANSKYTKTENKEKLNVFL
jgi:hypothetical protein